MKRTPQQEAVIESFRSGTGDVCVTARAGAGKTTVLIDGVAARPARTTATMCAFNKRIADELDERLQSAGAQRVVAKTLHSIGNRAIMRAFQAKGMRPRINKDREAQLAQEALGGDFASDDDVRNVAKLAVLVKESRPDGLLHDELRDFAIDQGLADSDDDEADTVEVAERRATAAEAVLERSLDTASGEISFADMLWLPLVMRWSPDASDLVCIDEAQDMNLSQLRLAARVRKSGGRIVVCGDDRQAIYSFRGAAPGALERVATGLRAERLKLTVTFRCATSIVDEARRIVPDLDPAPGAIAGEVRQGLSAEMLRDAKIGDFVLSRINAPLARICLGLIRAGTPARIAGNDIGPTLIKLVRRIAKRAGGSMKELLERLVLWRDREVSKAIAAKRQERAEFVIDQADTLIGLSEDCDDVSDLIDLIERVFADDGKPRVVCSTIHRAKGLEADRVWLLSDTLDRIKPKDEVQEVEEQNLRYVAITRARRELVYVHGGR